MPSMCPTRSGIAERSVGFGKSVWHAAAKYRSTDGLLNVESQVIKSQVVKSETQSRSDLGLYDLRPSDLRRHLVLLVRVRYPYLIIFPRPPLSGTTHGHFSCSGAGSGVRARPPQTPGATVRAVRTRDRAETSR